MNELVTYKVPIKGLSIGTHEYHFHITPKFFEAMQAESEYHCDIQLDLNLEMQSNMILLHFMGKGFITFPCDDCLEDFDLPIDFNHNIIAKFGHGSSDDDDIIMLTENDHAIDLSQIIYDDILLHIPIRKVHPEDENGNPKCDPKQLELLDSYRIHKKENDPRWDALKNIKFDN